MSLALAGSRRRHRPRRGSGRSCGTLRRIAHRGGEFLGLGAVVDHRADDAVGAGVERLLDVRRVVPRHAHQRRRVGGRDRLQHRYHHRVVDHAVLHVDHQRVPAHMGHDLGREARRQPEPAVDHGPSGRPGFPHSVCPRHHAPPFCRFDGGDPASYAGGSQAQRRGTRPGCALRAPVDPSGRLRAKPSPKGGIGPSRASTCDNAEIGAGRRLRRPRLAC